MTTTQLKKYFEGKGFIVNLFENGAELEIQTESGVNVVIHLSPFNEADFFSYVDDFDVNELADLYETSVDDFEKLHDKLLNIRVDLEYILDYEVDDEDYKNLLKDALKELKKRSAFWLKNNTIL